MKRFLPLLTLTGLLLVACGGTPLPNPDPSRSMTATPTALPNPDPSRSMTATPTALPITTSTPTPIGTWETVIDGVIYDNAMGPGKPIVGASVSYNVVHSYFAELQAGRPNKTIADEHGKFSLPVIVHDTDSIRLVVEASGFISHEERLVGVELVAGKSFAIGLTRVVTATVSPP